MCACTSLCLCRCSRLPPDKKSDTVILSFKEKKESVKLSWFTGHTQTDDVLLILAVSKGWEGRWMVEVKTMAGGG